MRYISPYANLKLYRKDGTIAHEFVNGVLIVGDQTTTNGTDTTSGVSGYVVDAFEYSSTPETEIFQIYSTTLDGGTDNRWELAGQGSLNGVDDNGDALDNLEDGYRGFFFEAPKLSGADGASSTEGVWYEVLEGSVTYGGTEYTVGQFFETDGDATTVTGDGYYALALPESLRNKCKCFCAEEFKIKHLQYGDEPLSYFFFGEGFKPRNSMTTTDADFYGWVR